MADAALAQFRELYRAVFYEPTGPGEAARRPFDAQWQGFPQLTSYATVPRFECNLYAELAGCKAFRAIIERLHPALARIGSLAVCSWRREEGRTSLALALARDLAFRLGQRVLAIDSDFHRPGLSGILGDWPAVTGVRDVLDGSVALERAGILSRTDRFMLLPLTAPFSRAHRQAIGVRELLDTVRPHLDLVIFDTPAARGQDKAIRALAERVDAVLIVTSPRTKPAQLRSLTARCQDAGTAVLGYVTNRMP